MGCGHGARRGPPGKEIEFVRGISPPGVDVFNDFNDTFMESPTASRAFSEKSQSTASTDGAHRFVALRSQPSSNSALSTEPMQNCAAGHSGAILSCTVFGEELADGQPACILKAYDETECRNYALLTETDDRLLPFTAAFHGEVNPVDLMADVEGRFLKLGNLLHGFGQSPHVMDCKIGFKSYLEDRVDRTVKRKDLYRKLVALDPEAPTPEERECAACTKLRYMSYKDNFTTLRRLCLRVEGIAHSTGKVSSKELTRLPHLAAIAQTVATHFLPTERNATALALVRVADVEEELPEDLGERGARLLGLLSATSTSTWSIDTPTVPASPMSSLTSGLSAYESPRSFERRLLLAESVLRSLRSLREAMEASAFVRSHVFVGASLLFVVETEGSSAGVFLIDLAKTLPVAEGLKADHNSMCAEDPNADGLFVGMDNAVFYWEQVRSRITHGDIMGEVTI